ncbi:MAG: multicopper oxidase domain-containing protein [Nitrospirota bacterium]
MAIKALPSRAGMIGMPMIHCHIPEHEDIGMMAVWHIMDTM